MERISIGDAHQNFADIIKREEEGEETMLIRYGRDIAHITIPEIEQTEKTHAFFSLLNHLKTRDPIKATPEEIKQWIQEGRM